MTISEAVHGRTRFIRKHFWNPNAYLELDLVRGGIGPWVTLHDLGVNQRLALHEFDSPPESDWVEHLVPPASYHPAFCTADRVEKVNGDYQFKGVVVAVFRKVSGKWRYVVEDDRGVLHIFSEKNLKLIP